VKNQLITVNLVSILNTELTTKIVIVWMVTMMKTKLMVTVLNVIGTVKPVNLMVNVTLVLETELEHQNVQLAQLEPLTIMKPKIVKLVQPNTENTV
jgi:hypothetical protein